MARHLKMVPLHHQAGSVADPTGDVHEQVVVDLTTVRLRRAILSLPHLERLVLELRWGLGAHPVLSSRKVARRLGLSVRRVAEIEAQALECLRADDQLRKAVAG